MLKNYFKIAGRNLRRNLGYTSINIGGLAVGIACVLLILAYVRDEAGYDDFHVDAERIYRVHVGEDQEVTPTAIAPVLKRSVPEVEAVTRLYDVGRFQPPVVRRGTMQALESSFFYADSTVFDVFSLPLVVGSPSDALSRPRTLVISQTLAAKYFGDENPIGQTLEIGQRRTPFEITAVMADLPSQSHVQFGLMASFNTTGWADREIWDSANFFTYAKLVNAGAASAVSAKMANLVEEARISGLVDDDYSLSLFPLIGIHLDFEGRSIYLYLLSAIALMILLIACVNYINLATARGARRAREVGVRKVAGAERLQLINQFLSESALTTLLALGLAVLIAELALPFFNDITGKTLDLNYFADPMLWVSMAGILLLVGIAGGAYPAFMLSSYEPGHIFKTTSQAGTGGSGLRRSLVVFQFSVSVVLIVGTAVIYQQLRYIQDKDLGFNKEQLVVLPMGLGNAIEESYPSIRGALLQETQIESVAAINHIPGYQEGGYGFWAAGVFEDSNTLPDIGGVPSDPHVVETLGLRLVAGQDFLPMTADSITSGTYQYLLNEAAVAEAGWTPEEAIGRRIALSGNRMGAVRGVIADYHFLSLHEKIQSLAYFYEPSGCNYMLVRLAAGNTSEAMERVAEVWAAMLPDRPFNYTFLDDEIGALYRSEQQTSRVFFLSAMLAIFIACLGLFGLAAFTTAQRRKEVGIRKVMGASVWQVMVLLTKEFSWLVVLGFGIAAPIAFAITQQWLQNFAYKAPLSIWLFLTAGLLVLCIAWFTVGYQAFRAARVNPVNALRYE